MKDTGKSSSRKLRRVIYYLLYRMDPQKTHYKISCSAKMSKLQNMFFFCFYIFPPLTPIVLRRALFLNIQASKQTTTITTSRFSQHECGNVGLREFVLTHVILAARWSPCVVVPFQHAEK